MPSKDRINPKANEWMEREGVHSPPSTVTSPASSRASKNGKGPLRTMSAQVQRLASRLGTNPDELAAKIPEDTLRRTKFPVLEIENDDGTRTFKHDPGIEEGRRALLRR